MFPVLLLLALAAPVIPADALARRREIGAVQFEAELSVLEKKRGWLRSREEAQRVAALQLARDGPSYALYERRLRRLRAFDAAVAAEMRQRFAGPWRTEWLNTRWAGLSIAARRAEARELFRRIFADQSEPTVDLPADIRVAGLTLLTARQGALQRANAAWLKGLLVRIGWFDISRYGRDASQAAWLIVQHADFDPAWQEQVLAALAPRAARGDMQADYYAYLSDRVAVNGGRPQTYGTQGRCVRPGEWQPFEIAGSAGLDERRRAVGLIPIAQYKAKFGCR